jgi:probable FeS assembly SUF system protein SufT
MSDYQEILLSREVEAVRIPHGDTIILPLGSRVFITQSLGGSYTVATEEGLARVAGRDADALGLEPTEEAAAEPGTELRGEALQAAVWEQLKTCFDPEIPVNVVDLGLVYDCIIGENDQGSTVEVKMTLTAPGCGMGPSIAADVQRKILTLPGVDSAEVDLVWDPPWNQDMISEVGKMKLGMI